MAGGGQALGVNGHVAVLTFNAYHRMNPCTVSIERQGRPTVHLPAVVIHSGSENDLRGKASRVIETRSFIVCREGCPDLTPRRGDTLVSDEKGNFTRYTVGAAADEPAVHVWKGNPQFLRVEARAVTGQ